jgi:hypothetical protein
LALMNFFPSLPISVEVKSVHPVGFPMRRESA